MSGPVADLLAGMLAIPSPSGAERDLAAFLAGRLDAMGFHAEIDAVGNVVGEIGAAPRPRVLVLGHLDTVSGAVPLRREDGRLYGRGAVDAKGPLAAAACAAAACAALPARFVVAGAVEEEVASSAGAHHLLRSQPAPDAVVVAEPTGWTGVGIGYKGRTGLRFSVTRPATHSSSPEEKAVEVAVELYRRVRDHLDGLGGGPGVFDRATATLIRLDGDMVRAGGYLTCRVPPGFDFDAFEAFLRTVAAGARLEVDERTPAVRRDATDPVVRALVAAVRARGRRPVLKLKTGTSDMNLAHEAWACPIAAYGPGDSRLDHTDDEHVEEAELERGVDVLAAGLAGLVGTLEAAARPAEGLDDEDEELVSSRLRALGYLE